MPSYPKLKQGDDRLTACNMYACISTQGIYIDGRSPAFAWADRMPLVCGINESAIKVNHVPHRTMQSERREVNSMLTNTGT